MRQSKAKEINHYVWDNLGAPYRHKLKVYQRRARKYYTKHKKLPWDNVPQPNVVHAP